MRKVALIYNSQNKSSKIVKIKKEIQHYFSQNGYDLTIYETTHQLRSNDILNTTEALIYIICGGDGTAHEVVNASHRNKKILYIPTGTINDFGATLKMDKDILKNLELIKNDTFLEVDSGLVGSQYFNYVLAAGPMADVSFKTPSSLKKKLGHFAYVMYALKSVKELLKHMNVEVIVDGEPKSLVCDFIFITNSNSVSSFRKIYRDISITDGKFECLIVKKTFKPIQIYLGLRAALFGVDKLKSKHIEKFQFSHLKINTNDNIQWIIDGEEGPRGSVEVSVIKNNLTLYSNRKEKK